MNLTEIFKESFSFSIQNWKKLLIIGILLFIPGIFGAIYQMYNNVVLVAIAAILAIVFGFIVEGYTLSVIGDTIKGSDLIPDIALKTNFVDGLKVLVVEIVYGIVLAIIFAIILAITGSLKLLPALFATQPVATANMTAAATPAVNTAVANLPTAGPLVFVGLILIVIIAIVAMFFMVISTCRLAKTGSIKAALSWSGITEDLKAIGVGRLVAWYILLVIIVLVISFIVGIIAGLIALIPVVGIIISVIILTFLFAPFLVLFSARAMGLLYADA